MNVIDRPQNAPLTDTLLDGIAHRAKNTAKLNRARVQQLRRAGD